MSKEKKERNQRLYQYWMDHPNMTQRAIGKVFRISHVRVHKIIIKRQKELKKEA